MDRFIFRSFGSGSSGNSYFVGSSSYGILIDAGVGVRNTRRFLKNMGFDYHQIWAVFVTHDHADHIKAVGSIGEKHHVPVYATENVHKGIDRNYIVTQKLSASKRFIEIGIPYIIGDFKVTAFPVSHDASESVGYTVEYAGRKISFATDLGYIDDNTAMHLTGSDAIVLEANFDEKMLEDGRYPAYLKERIRAKTGHLSNVQTADFLSENYTNRWKYVFLCHLSKDNNTPQKAYDTIVDQLMAEQIEFSDNTEIIPLPRIDASSLYYI